MSYPKPFLDEIRARVPLSDVVGKRVRLQRAGHEFKGCCPFHKEKTPSFTLNDQKGFYHCFGCGAHGDVINFLMENDRQSFPEAVETLAGLAGLEVPKPTPEQQQRYEKQDQALVILDAAAKWFTEQLYRAENHLSLSYMQNRGLSSAVLKRFRVGYAPAEGNKFITAMTAQGYKLPEMEKLGLVRKSRKNDGSYYPFFRERIIFPVADARGRVVAFGGRVLPEHYGGPSAAGGKTPPKYLNSPDHDLFHKGRMLYGLIGDVRKAAASGQPLAIVEGYMDVISLAQYGYQAAVAPLGTALTETQVEEAWKMIHLDGMKAPVLCFDGDEAGRRAASRALERVLPILKPDHSVRFVFLPEGHDPDTLVQEKGRAGFEAFLNNPVNLFDMMWDEETQRRSLTTPEAAAGFKNALLTRAKQIADRDIQSLFMRQVDKRFRELFYQNPQSGGRFGKQGKTWNGKNGSSAYQGGKKNRFAKNDGSIRPLYMPVRRAPEAARIREQILVATLLNYPELFEEFGEIFGMLPAKTQEFDTLRHDIVDLLSADPEMTGEALQKELAARGHAALLRKVLDDSIYLHAGFARPGQDLNAVREGWQDTLSFVQQQG